MAPLWAEVPAAVQIKLTQITFDTVKNGLRETEKIADRRALKLAEDEHNHCRDALAKIANDLDASVAELEAPAASKTEEARVLKLRARSAHAATTAKDKAHAKQVGRLYSEPRASTSTGMDPPPARQRVTAAAATSTRPTLADFWATVTSRTHLAPPRTTVHPLIDYTYLDIRVSTYRLHNENFPADIKDQIFDLSVAIYAALDKMNHGKAPLRLARDLASKKRSPLRPEIIDGIFTLCDAVHWACNSNADCPWFMKTTRNAQDAARREPHPRADFSASIPR